MIPESLAFGKNMSAFFTPQRFVGEPLSYDHIGGIENISSLLVIHNILKLSTTIAFISTDIHYRVHYWHDTQKRHVHTV